MIGRAGKVSPGVGAYWMYCGLTSLIVALFLWQAWSRSWELVESRLEFTSMLIAEWLDSAFIASDYLLRDMAGQIDPAQLRYPHPDPAAQAELSARLDQRRATFPHAFLFGAFDHHCIVTHGNALLGFDASEREYCQRLRDDPSLDSVVTHGYYTNIGPVNVTHARALRDDDGGLLGLVAIALDTEFFNRWLNQVGSGAVDTLAIIDHQQMLLARYPALPDAVGQRIDSPEKTDFLNSGEPSRILFLASPLDQKPRYFIARRIEHLPFSVLVGINRHHMLSDWLRLGWLSLGALLLSWLVGYMVLRNYQILLRSRAKMRELAQTDQLTGIPNRAYFSHLAERRLSMAKSNGSPVSLILFDIDRFKSINDGHGHLVGDRAIEAFAAACRLVTRTEDVIGRWGGDEFVILIDEDERAARALADRLRDQLQALGFITEGGEHIALVASFGVASSGPNPQKTLDELIREADLAMFQAKKCGRNRVRRFADEPDPPQGAKDEL